MTNNSSIDKYDLSVYGTEWGAFIPKKYIKGDHIENNELYKYYGSADILLNDHWDDMREKGFISNRIFDALACGTIILSDDVNDWGELKDFVTTYKNAPDLPNIIEKLSIDKTLFSKRAREGKTYIINNHTFEARAITLSEQAKIFLLSTLS
jgi:spore maturation protein CgeB